MNKIVKTKTFSLWEIDGLSVQSGLNVLNEKVKSLVNEVPRASYADAKFDVHGDGILRIDFLQTIPDYEVKEINRKERKKKLAELLAIEEKETILLREKFEYLYTLCTNPETCDSVTYSPNIYEYHRGIYIVIVSLKEVIISVAGSDWRIKQCRETGTVCLENITLENLLENY